MLAANYSSLRNNLKEYCDRVCESHETLIVTRKNDQNVVMMSLEKYSEMEKILNNIQYLNMLTESDKQLREGKIVKMTMEDLDKMAVK